MARLSLSLCVFCSLSVISPSLSAWAQSPSEKKDAAAANASTYWIFLNTGKSSKGTERSELEKMQAAHIANFGRLFDAGKLFAAGPLADPRKQMRGIVVVRAEDRNALAELFEPDPYLKHGFLKLDAMKFEIALGAFQKDIKDNPMAEYRLVLLEKQSADGKELDANERKENLAYCETIHDAERLCLAGWLSDDNSPRRGILIFRKLDEAKLNALVDGLPAVKSKTWKGTSLPLYMSEGIAK